MRNAILGNHLKRGFGGKAFYFARFNVSRKSIFRVKTEPLTEPLRPDNANKTKQKSKQGLQPESRVYFKFVNKNTQTLLNQTLYYIKYKNITRQNGV